jgi:hypothetical protein
MGDEVFAGCAGGFRILVREENDWTSPLPEDFPAPETVPAGTELLLLADRSLALTEDSVYDAGNPYAGSDVTVQIVSLTPAARDAVCLLSVHGEAGQLLSADSREVTLAPGLNTVLFRSVDLQFAGEGGCRVSCYLLDKSTLLPLTESTSQTLLK